MKLLNLITVFLSVTAVELFSMYGDREGVISPEHAEEIRREEENRLLQEEMQRFRQEREQARQRAAARRQREIEQEGRLAEEGVAINQAGRQNRIITRRLFGD